MDQKKLMDATVQVKRIGNLLNEVLDISQQIDEAANRNDQVSMELLVNMREEPIEKLRLADTALREQIDRFSDRRDADRLAELLNGAPARQEEEKTLAGLVAINRRRLERVLELDKVLGRKVAREKSVYQ